MKADERDSWLRPITRQLGGTPLSNVLGVVQIAFSLDPNRGSNTVTVPIDLANSSYYMKLDETSVIVANTNNLYFVVRPPLNPTCNPGELMGGFSDADASFLSVPQPLNSDLTEVALLQRIREEISDWRNLHLSGAIGTWTFYILSSTKREGADLDNLERDWTMTIRIPYLQVRHARR